MQNLVYPLNVLVPGKLGCALCLIGSVIIVLHAPGDENIEGIDKILHYAHPSFPRVPSSSFRKYVPSTALLTEISAVLVSGSGVGFVPNQNAQSTQRRHQDRRRKGVGGKI